MRAASVSNSRRIAASSSAETSVHRIAVGAAASGRAEAWETGREAFGRKLAMDRTFVKGVVPDA